MGKKTDVIGKALAEGLQLSSDEQFELDKRKELKRTAYSRSYWQNYTKRIKRVFGTVSQHEYIGIEKRAKASGLSIWGQVWAESCAYRNDTIVPTQEIADQQRILIAELRRIGNNINQLAKIGHIKARKHGGLGSSADDNIGVETLRQFARLEAAIAKFGCVLCDDNNDY